MYGFKVFHQLTFHIHKYISRNHRMSLEKIAMQRRYSSQVLNGSLGNLYLCGHQAYVVIDSLHQFLLGKSSQGNTLHVEQTLVLKARSGSLQVVVFPMASCLDVFVLPDGLGGELLSVGCDDWRLQHLQVALRAARSTTQLNAKEMNKEAGSLGLSLQFKGQTYPCN